MYLTIYPLMVGLQPHVTCSKMLRMAVAGRVQD